MLVTLSGMTTKLKLEQSRNASPTMVVKPLSTSCVTCHDVRFSIVIEGLIVDNALILNSNGFITGIGLLSPVTVTRTILFFITTSPSPLNIVVVPLSPINKYCTVVPFACVVNNISNGVFLKTASSSDTSGSLPLKLRVSFTVFCLNVIVSKFEQSKNAPLLMLVTALGMMIEIKLEQPENA